MEKGWKTGLWLQRSVSLGLLRFDMVKYGVSILFACSLELHVMSLLVLDVFWMVHVVRRQMFFGFKLNPTAPEDPPD